MPLKLRMFKMAEEKDQNKAQEQAAPKGPFVHQLQVYLVGGQTFTINEVTDSPNMPNNVVAFINAWRQKRDVWHSPNNDPKFGVRVKDVFALRIPRRYACTEG